MAKEDFYFKLFYKRLLTSTIGWTDEEFGAYMRLLIAQFDGGSISSDFDELKRIAPSVKKNWKLLEKKFKDNGNGRLINEFMNDVRMDVDSKKSVNKENGKLGGRPKKKNPIHNPNETETKPNGYFLETQPITETKGIQETVYSIQDKPEREISAQSAIRGVVVSNVEEMVLKSSIQFEQLCVATGKPKEIAKASLRNYHLYLEEKENYPKPPKALWAGFEKWLRNEKMTAVPLFDLKKKTNVPYV